MNIDPNIPKPLQLYTADQSREIDRRTIEEFGIDGFTLMEMAAKGAATTIQNYLGENKQGLFVCGKGNNAGDALAAARYLTENAGHHVSIFFALGTDNLSPDCDKNYSLLKKLSEHSDSISFLNGNLEDSFPQSDYLVDGLFGTGLASEIRSPVKEITEQINRLEKPVFSMDLPSGLNADTGTVHGVTVRADHTCTFGTQKTGLFINNGPTYSGTVHFTDLPFPSYLRKNFITGIDPELSKVLPKISRQARHKYEDGVVHLIAGSPGLTGAAIMAAKSAWRQGAGSVILYTPEALLPIYENALPQIIKIVLDDSASFQPRHVETILQKIIDKPGVLLMGPGMGTSDQTREFTTSLLKSYAGPAVIDADALACWESLKNIDSERRKEWLLTPHPGEAKKYLGFDSQQLNPITVATEFSNQNNVSLLLKGNPTIYIPYNSSPFMTTYDTAPFSRAGFGDVLSGSVATWWGISKSLKWAPVYALLDGYTNYISKKESQDSFGPEDLT
ncbi:NAD(P)H-hydrate epimerase [Rhodohalobacter halophilus]|uniref:NAD(P)H-hydrate epimerase n=1 Tax=Rhodohalobacter halophilus TaxID=1812810 RepID=UPI000A01C1C9|nr:NAD(P)H-hydrate epimerase [Rhodohalobacter halophilus]